MLKFDNKQQNSVKQLSVNKKNKFKKLKNKKPTLWQEWTEINRIGVK